MKTKIIIAGIGGVGGYFGGLLAKEYLESNDVEVNFLARGKNLEVINNQGLTVTKKDISFVTKPNLATNNANILGKADLIILAIKSYDLEDTLFQLKNCIKDDTVILPLLNGVNSREKIQKLFPENLVLEGCVYIISRLSQPGKIENLGNIETLYFGNENMEDKRLSKIEKIFSKAKIDAVLSKDILTVVWEKFIFISAFGTSTSYFNKTAGEIFENSETENQLKLLLKEVCTLARTKKIKISEDFQDTTLKKMKSLHFTATSSMHTDYINKKPKTELESLTGYVISESKKYGLETPSFEKMYQALLSR